MIPSGARSPANPQQQQQQPDLNPPHLRRPGSFNSSSHFAPPPPRNMSGSLMGGGRGTGNSGTTAMTGGPGGYHSHGTDSSDLNGSSTACVRSPLTADPNSVNYASAANFFRSSGADDEFTAKYDSVAPELAPGFEKFCAIRHVWTGGQLPCVVERPDGTCQNYCPSSSRGSSNALTSYFGVSSNSNVSSGNLPPLSNNTSSSNSSSSGSSTAARWLAVGGSTGSRRRGSVTSPTRQSGTSSSSSSTNSFTSGGKSRKPVMDSESICDILTNPKVNEFKQRVPLEEVVDVLVELWEDEGLFE